MKEVKIKAIDDKDHTSIVNQEINLYEVPDLSTKLSLKQGTRDRLSSQTDENGIASFQLDETQIFRSYFVLLGEQNNYAQIPTRTRPLIAFNIFDEIEELRFKCYEDVFRLNIYTDDERYFFQKGDKINLKAYHPDSIQEENIQYAFTFISKHLELEDILQGKELSPGNEEELQNNPAKCLNNAKFYILKDKNNQAYKGKEVKDYELNHVVNDSKMIIFAYTAKPLENVYVEIVLHDIIQISIDCSMHEALNAKDEVSQLGWSISYVLQRLWHDNPRHTKSVSELKYQNSQELMESIENETMKALIAKYAYDIELKKFEIKQKLEKGIDPCNFYLELDWEDFIEFNLISNKHNFHL